MSAASRDVEEYNGGKQRERRSHCVLENNRGVLVGGEETCWSEASIDLEEEMCWQALVVVNTYV
jgi:hypothetical protein